MGRSEPSDESGGARAVRIHLAHQLQTAIADLPRGAPTDEEIHTARKHMKAARATLRLLRPLLPEAAYELENRRLRDAARALSAARDDTVLLKSLRELTQRTKGAGKRWRLAALRARLQRAARRRRRALVRHGLRQSAVRLRSSLSVLQTLPLPPPEWQALYRSLRRTYRRGRSCARHNARRPSGATLHEWRKRAKYLRSQLEVMAPETHARVQAMAKKLHRLSDHLGEEHDLAVLAELARRHAGQLGREAHAALQKRIDKRRRKMRKRALAVGLRLYAEKPRHFESRVRGYARRHP